MKTVQEIISKLNNASNEYYNGLKCSMTDFQWDELFDELLDLEELSGIIYANSPTQNAGYVIMNDKLSKTKHSTPLLSLAKTQSIDNMIDWLGDKEGVLSNKVDGGTQKLQYDDYKLKNMSTRGSSSTNEGQDITHNSMSVLNIPKYISIGNIQIVGEGVMYKSKFNEINSKLSIEDKYQNPRNLANATSSMLDSKIVAGREIRFLAFNTLEYNGFKTKMEEFAELKSMGFEVVEHVLVNKNNLRQEIERMRDNRDSLPYEIDGLVLAFNDIEYGNSLGKTSHHINSAKAFKFNNDSEETILRSITTDVGKSGQISYIANFDTIQLNGTDVSKATLHNYEFINSLELGIGDIIVVIKGGEIIPKIIDNETRSGTFIKPLNCPCCNTKLIHNGIHQFCPNYNCDNQVVGRLVQFCSRDAMNIQGVSEQTIRAIRSLKIGLKDRENLVLSNATDFYNLYQYKEEMYKLDRFGKNKVDKLLAEIEKSKTQSLDKIIYGLSIPQIGRTASKKIAEKYDNINKLRKINSTKELIMLLGDSCGNSFAWFLNNEIDLLDTLEYHGLTMTQDIPLTSSTRLVDKIFVVTGEVTHFKNRKELESKIVSLGGKIGSGINQHTSYLINNDFESKSSKNVKAKVLGVSIINEEQFLEMIK